MRITETHRLSSRRAGWGDAVASQMYTDRLRVYRKNIAQLIGSKTAVARFNSVQDLETRRFLLRVLDKPEDLVQHIRT